MFKLCVYWNLRLLKRTVPFVITLALAYRGFADVHWTTNGTHTGVLVRAVPAGSKAGLDSHEIPRGHDFIGTFTLAYGLWTISGEPLHEFIFTWDWHTTNLTLAHRGQRIISSLDLNKYPDLKTSFYALKPISMTLKATIEFYDSAGNRFALAQKLINPGVVEQAGAKAPFHAPGSPRWADFFRTAETNTLSPDQLDRRHKELFLKAARVELTEPDIKSITWPESTLSQIVGEFCRREGWEPESKMIVLSSHAQSTLVVTNPTLVGTSGPPAMPLQTPLNPLEQPANRISTKENPFERAARLEAEKRSERPSP